MSSRVRIIPMCALACGWIGSAVAAAQTAAAPFGPPVDDQRVYVHGLVQQFEARFGGYPASLRWDGEGWIGTDTNRLWIKSEGFAQGGRVEEGQHELLYARPISPYFDVQAGTRYDLDSRAGRGWAALGVEGLAPYFFQFSATLYASDAGHFAAKIVTNYEQLLTQRLILEPLVELNVYSRPDARRGARAGLSDLDTGVRLRYEIRRKFAPYLGVVYERTSGPGVPGGSVGTARTGDWRFTSGVRAWF